MKLWIIEKTCRMNKHMLYLNYTHRSNKFIWRKLYANILAGFFLQWQSGILWYLPEKYRTNRAEALKASISAANLIDNVEPIDCEAWRNATGTFQSEGIRNVNTIIRAAIGWGVAFCAHDASSKWDTREGSSLPPAAADSLGQ